MQQLQYHKLFDNVVVAEDFRQEKYPDRSNRHMAPLPACNSFDGNAQSTSGTNPTEMTIIHDTAGSH